MNMSLSKVILVVAVILVAAVAISAPTIWSRNSKQAELDRIEKHKLAIETFSEYISKYPTGAYWYCDRGYERGGIGDNRGAIQDFDQAIKLEPTDLLTAV